MKRLVHDDGWRPDRDDLVIFATAIALGLLMAFLIACWGGVVG